MSGSPTSPSHPAGSSGGASQVPPNWFRMASLWSAMDTLSQCSGLLVVSDIRSSTLTELKPKASIAPVTEEVPLRCMPTTTSHGPSVLPLIPSSEWQSHLQPSQPRAYGNETPRRLVVRFPIGSPCKHTPGVAEGHRHSVLLSPSQGTGQPCCCAPDEETSPKSRRDSPAAWSQRRTGTDANRDEEHGSVRHRAADSGTGSCWRRPASRPR